MDAEQAKALREPFPASAIGKLPKGGVMLDYVGHAATTDRLLTVDPEWNWRPFTAEEIMSLPPSLRDAGLWIHLTVCGVTRPGVGDGKSAKECIGDAIRNAAMRFGVALDLWAKEDLHEISQHKDAAPPAARTPPPQGAADEPMKKSTRGAMFALFTERGIAEDDQRAGISRIVGREIESRGELTEAEAQAVIKSLRGSA